MFLRKKSILKNNSSNITKIALETIEIEKKSLSLLKKSIDENFINCVKEISKSKGRVVITGIGKSAIIANKIVSTLNSTGTPALFMHAADAVHGDLGMILKEDIVICISKSGESPEIKLLVPLLKNAGNKLAALVGNINSSLAKSADFVLNATVEKEACPNNLAPTSSTTAQMVLGDVLAVCLLKMKNFSANDFAKFHPGGALGKQLYLRVDDLIKNHPVPKVYKDDHINKVIMEITSKRLGATAVLNDKNDLVGIITDGDLRRMLEKEKTFESLKAKDVMGKKPRTIQQGELAVNALQLMRQNSITQIIVVDKKKYLGMVHIHDLLKEGLL